jgi:hypothetical protein
MERAINHLIKKTVHKCLLFVLIAMMMGFANIKMAQANEAPHEGSHEIHRHHMALIVGNTQSEESSNGPSIGVDYEYRLNQWFGLGGLVEYAGGDFEHLLLVVPLFIHPYKGWLFNVALGTEVHKEHGDHEEDKRTRDWIVRTGVAYQFPFGSRYTIAPEFNVDVSEHETTISYGLAFGLGF